MEVKDHSQLVDGLVADGLLMADDCITVEGRSAFRDVAGCRDAAGVEPRMYFQKVTESKVAKNRVHLDIHVDPDDKDGEVARLIGIGAELIGSHSDRGSKTYVLRDPEGNEFCLH